ncbi:LysM peptidoglycan-binding domain-containing protein [Clostridium grantii]|uniref:LysM repeat-containing protein n=1 Tax=Clostridium grantii DSM 8605 TaxID=1121316 RepID=A0A1M5RG88_9CLOT|nr:LysM peptidoglycan-binding domain-containing protein [Clostridium grantii]SHH25372.1 LysM repeat-containing protein [Clostridium grantii DSM 8605]
MNHKKIASFIATLLIFGNTVTANASIINHKVTSGDSIWKISQTYNMTSSELMNLNKLTSNTIYIGQILKVNDSTIEDYQVVSGDSYWKISQKFNTTVDKLLQLNNTTSTTLKIGQVLYVPFNSSSINVSNSTSSTSNNTVETKITTYTVKSGDSLWKISQTFNTTAENLMTINNLTSSSIYIGQVLKLTSSTSNTPIKETIIEEPVTKIETINYTVTSGDNLWNIAQKYCTTMNAIKSSNSLATDILMPGQIITIPVNSKETVAPVGITMTRKRSNDNYGDLYTWENGRRLFTVGQTATLKDLTSGITFNVKYYGGSNHADIVTLTQQDTDKLKKVFPSWSWSSMKPMVLYFSQNGVNHQLAVSITGMPHSSTDIFTNGLDGHIDMYFYNSTSHVNNTINTTHQNNILIANGQ